jgi:hypothetical protein
MAKQIARLLKTNVMADIDVPAIAQFLQAQGQRGDSILAHINPKEAALLQKMGGAGTPNPVTGLPEFFSIDPDYAYGADYAPTSRAASQGFDATDVNYDLSQFDLPEFNDYYEVPAGGGGIDFNVDIPQTARALPMDIETDIPGLRAGGGVGMRRQGATGLNLPNVPTVAPDLTMPERPSAATLGPASMRAREAADLELAREGAPATGVNRIAQALGLSGSDLARLGLAGLGVYQGVRASREAAEAGREARREQEALAQPYREQGQQLVSQAQRGELTAPAQQQLAALRARSAQAAAARGGGGAGAAQAEAQIEAFRQQLLQNQYDYGMKVSNIGDQIALGAIRTGLEADRYASSLANNYFQNMARVAVGMPGEGGR